MPSLILNANRLPELTLVLCFMILPWAAVTQPMALAPSLSFGGTIYPARNVRDQPGTYARQAVFGRINVPIVKTLMATDRGPKFFLLAAGLHASAENAKFSFLGFNRSFYTGNFSLTSIYKTPGKASWFTKAALSYFEDDSSRYANPSLRATGLLLHRHNVSESFFYLVGGAYNFVYGAGIPLPVLGLGWTFTNHATLTAILPFTISYRFGSLGNPYTVFIRPNGGVSNFYNNTFSVNKGSIITIRRREILIGVKKRIRLSDHWSVGVEGGFAAGRKISFSKSVTQRSDETFPSYSVKGGPYLSFSVRFKMKARQPANDLIGDSFDLDSLLPNP